MTSFHKKHHLGGLASPSPKPGLSLSTHIILVRYMCNSLLNYSLNLGFIKIERCLRRKQCCHINLSFPFMKNCPHSEEALILLFVISILVISSCRYCLAPFTVSFCGVFAGYPWRISFL